MPLPLPGMDPYLEDSTLWPNFRRHLLASLRDVIVPSLGVEYRIRGESRNFISEFILFTTVERHGHEEEFLEIRSRVNRKLITLIDVTSIATRTTTAGREAYLATRRAALEEQAAYVEIDLITQGKPILDFDRSGLPQHDHTITVTRTATPDRYEIYTAGVRKRLPKFKLPLASDDRDMVLDLQAIFANAYAAGAFELLVNYQRALPAEVKLNAADRDWVMEQVC